MKQKIITGNNDAITILRQHVDSVCLLLTSTVCRSFSPVNTMFHSVLSRNSGSVLEQSLMM